jgi:molybdenum cofactor cytidylyltransferase
MIAGVVLAAGESSRMGRDKALLVFRGRTFLETSISTLREAGVEPIVVVLGHHAQEIRRAANLERVQVVVNENYSHGQTSSLQAGLLALADPKIEAAMLWLVDHPAVSTETVGLLMAKFRETHASVIIPRYRGERGHPVLISRDLFAELLQLSPGEGANAVMRKHRDETTWLEVNDAGVLEDIDDPESYRQLQT